MAESVAALARSVASVPPERKVVLGLDTSQVEILDGKIRAAAGRRLQIGEVMGSGRGYFKLRRGPPGDIVNASGVVGALSCALQCAFSALCFVICSLQCCSKRLLF